MSVNEATATAAFQEILRDVVECTEFRAISTQLGLVPAGPDVEEIEHYRSHVRCDRVIPILRELMENADIAANVLYRLTHLSCAHDEEQIAAYVFVARTSIAAVVARLADQGALTVNGCTR